VQQNSETICGYSVESRSGRSCVDEIIQWIADQQSATGNGGGRWLACLNPHSYAVALTNPAFSESLRSSDWLTPDGSGVVLASRILGGSIRERITGSDIFFDVCQRLDKRGGSVFFLGSTDTVLAKIGAKMKVDYPNVTVAGTYSPPFKSDYSQEELDEMIAAVNSASPDVLWVGMTAPKQEKWIAENLDRLDVRFAAAIGAVFDFYVGNVKRSHQVFQSLGLEWLPRLIQQPRRLWRRMFISAPIFMWHVIKARFGYHSEC
jgi:N-acetylglucosaminyldiphosphoundecaprenol N-acetyl-beta-D-mannosaminyltransferase